MDAYIYRAALYCTPCAESLQQRLPPDPDSERYPQGPYASGGGLADTPQHCPCGTFLKNPLTPDGLAYVHAALDGEHSDPAILRIWRDHYVTRR